MPVFPPNLLVLSLTRWRMLHDSPALYFVGFLFRFRVFVVSQAGCFCACSRVRVPYIVVVASTKGSIGGSSQQTTEHFSILYKLAKYYAVQNKYVKFDPTFWGCRVCSVLEYCWAYDPKSRYRTSMHTYDLCGMHTLSLWCNSCTMNIPPSSDAPPPRSPTHPERLTPTLSAPPPTPPAAGCLSTPPHAS